MKNIVLLGGSNSVMVNGLQKGLREYANVTNLALGGSTCLQNLYELKREKNQEAIKNADLIVTESNINELHQHLNEREQLSLEIIFRNMQYFYASLYELKIPVCVIILPSFHQNKYNIIHNMHKYLVNFYKFSLISLHDYYKKYNLVEFGNKFGHHQLCVVNKALGSNISKNIDKFVVSNISLKVDIPNFKIITPKNMNRNSLLKVFTPKNSIFDEVVYRLEYNSTLNFENEDGYKIIGIHSWMLEEDGSISKIPVDKAQFQCGSICISSHKNTIIKSTSKLNRFFELQAEPLIGKDLQIQFNSQKLPDTEFYSMSISNHTNSISLPYFDLIAFFLCKPNPNMELFDLSVIPNDKDIEIDRDIDRSHLIPNIVFFKDSMEFIDEYIGYLYPNITKHIDKVLTPQIINKIKEHLLVLQPPKATPQQPKEPSLQDQINLLKEQISKKDNEIKALQTSYQKAANFKNHLSYKLGNSLIKAHKSWYKGGYIKFIFEAIKIKNEHKWQN
ncbi:hypothetical protein [Campylobacter porcelli]|uniref:Sugar transferase n=1 Tax=Campylobacter porcelli TaxID=1660073 RepID=A0A1X9SVH1_9BACT|nr:hypothetical protein [Campylobacter sp. RM6137]ARR00119.1 hypothetical protein CSUIS_0278 [Campylobacter sp. RM6137]